jgi:pyruvate,water dikinase
MTTKIKSLVKSIFGVAQEEAADYRNSIETMEQFDALAASPPTAAFAGTRTVKCVLDLRPAIAGTGDVQVYFLQSVKYPFHFRFCQSHLLTAAERADPYAHHKFNDRHYVKEDREYVLLTICNYDFVNQFVLEPWPADNLSAARMAQYVQIVASRFKIGAIVFRPMSDWQERVVAPVVAAAGLRVTTAKELFGKIRFQPVVCGRTVGKLRFLSGAASDAALKRVRVFDVLVLNEQVLDLPLCAGLITSFPQTPLSHTSLLCQNRGTPSLALVGVAEPADALATDELNAKDRARIELVRSLDGKWVSLSVAQQDFTIVEISKADAIAQLKQQALQQAEARGTDTIKLKPNFDITEPLTIPCQSLPSGIDKCIGAKAFQLARVANIAAKSLASKLPLAPIVGIVLPFAYYRQFMVEIGADKLVAATEAALQSENSRLAATNDDFYASVDPSLFASALDVDVDLDELTASRSPLTQSFQLDDSGNITTPIRQQSELLCSKLERAILSAPIDLPSLTAACDVLQSQLLEWNGVPVILRSSTNVEDLDGFNGAGLYASLSCKDPLDRAKLAGTIVKCYASLWTKRCVIERFTFGVDESSVAMALLVQPYATNIVANGVALSKIPFRLDFPGTYICSNHLDFKVTDDDGTAETLAVYDEHDGTVEVVSRSSRLNGAPVLHESDAQHIHVCVKRLARAMEGDSGAVDVEFIVQEDPKTHERKLLLLQCRPCVFREN